MSKNPESKKYLNYIKQRADEIARQGQNFNQDSFNSNYFRNVNIKDFKQIEKFFSQYSEILGSIGFYELSKINNSFNDYSSCQEYTKKTINYFESLSIESIIEKDDSDFTNTKQKTENLKSELKTRIDELSKSKNYDGLTPKDFKYEGDSDHDSYLRFSEFIHSTFKGSKQSKSDNLNVFLAIKKDFNKTIKKMKKFEAKKLELNNEAAQRMYAQGDSISFVDETLGEGYNNKKNWKKDLSENFKYYYENICEAFEKKQ